jgi:protein CpxP
MKVSTTTLALAGSLLATASMAQTTATPTRPVPPSTTSGVNPSTGTAPGTGIVNRNTGPAAASGDRNQAVATTNANAPQPTKGANSFTDGEARRRIESNGYTDVSGLQKDADGIWHGTAKKGGNTIKVWLDYKGNVGAS